MVQERKTLSGKILSQTMVNEWEWTDGKPSRQYTQDELSAYFSLSVNNIVNGEKVNTVYVCGIYGFDARIIYLLKQNMWVLVDGLYSVRQDMKSIPHIDRLRLAEPTNHFMKVWKVGKLFFPPKEGGMFIDPMGSEWDFKD